MSTHTQTLNAGIPVTFPGGEQFHLLEADEPVDVTFYESRNKPLETWKGMKGGFRISFEKGFIQVRLVSATGQTVKIAGTSGRGEYDRSQGDVNILNIVKDNSWYYDTRQKEAFIGSGSAYTDMDGKAGVQLWNPAASGKNLLCHAISVMATVTAFTIPLHIAYHNAALADDGIDGNKWLTEAIGAGQVKQAGSMVALLGTDIALFPMQPNIYIPLPLSKPILIEPGSGLTLQIDQIDKHLTGTFQWIEIAA